MNLIEVDNLPRALMRLDLKIFGGPKAVIPKNAILKYDLQLLLKVFK